MAHIPRGVVLPALPAAILGALLGAGGCAGERAGPEALDRLLPPESDLYAYSLAVAERARSVADPGWHLPIFHVARVHQRFGMDDLALATCREALELDPCAAGVHRTAGFILSNADRLPEAVDAYQQALLCEPEAQGVYTAMGLVLMHLKRLDDAAEALEHEIRRGTASADTYYHLGETLRLRGRHEDATRHLRRSLELAPGKREALYGLAQCLLALGREEEAAEPLESFREIKAEADRQERESRASKDNLDEQRRHAADTWADAHEVLFFESRRAKDPAGARRLARASFEAVEQSLRFDPRRPGAYLSLMEHHRAAGEPRKALELARRAVEALPEDSRVHYWAARLHLEVAPRTPPGAPPSREALEAVALLERAVALEPGFAAAHLELARAILHRHRDASLLPRALEHARQALALADPPGPENYDVLAYACNRNGLDDQALELLRAGARRFPADAGLAQRLRTLEESRR